MCFLLNIFNEVLARNAVRHNVQSLNFEPPKSQLWKRVTTSFKTPAAEAFAKKKRQLIYPKCSICSTARQKAV